jgi:AbiTii
MKLLDEIIDLLADENASLNSALLKTKVLMHTIGHAELAEWVNDELNGYPKDKPLPPYRIVGGRVAGNIQNMVMIQANVNLPTYHLPEKLKNWLENHELREAMSVLQDMANAKPGNSLHMPLSPEIGAQIDKGMDGYWVQKCWVEMQPLQIKNGISQVRSRLLDFALNLRDKIGGVEEKEVKARAATTDVPGMFHGAVFGDNATVVVGNDNRIRVSNKKRDFDALAKILVAKGVSEEDVANLKAAVASDEGKVDVASKSFGPAVKSWMGTMMQKAVNAAWQIELGVAGGLLTEALKAYYF